MSTDDLKCPCSIGIMAHNEEANIKALLQSIFSQALSACEITEIIVVSSGSSDNTEVIVGQFLKIDSRIKLIIQQKRLGKASAINLFLSNAKNNIAVLVNSDTVLDEHAIELLIRAFANHQVGAAGGHPVPINSADTFTGYCSRLLWNLHHRISLKVPKIGELAAIRKDIINTIPEETAVDEVCLEAIAKKKGYELTYVPGPKYI